MLLIIQMVGVTELESVTSTMSTWRSNQLSYTPFQDSVFLNIFPGRRICKCGLCFFYKFYAQIRRYT